MAKSRMFRRCSIKAKTNDESERDHDEPKLRCASGKSLFSPRPQDVGIPDAEPKGNQRGRGSDPSEHRTFDCKARSIRGECCRSVESRWIHWAGAVAHCRAMRSIATEYGRREPSWRTPSLQRQANGAFISAFCRFAAGLHCYECCVLLENSVGRAASSPSRACLRSGKVRNAFRGEDEAPARIQRGT